MRLKTRLSSKALSALSLLVSLSFVSSGATAQDFQIRTRVDLVVVPVTVKGPDERILTSLKQEDFVVLEDGRPQTITNFTIDPVPLSAAVIVDTGLSPASLIKVQGSFPALAGAFSEFDEVAVYRYDNFVTKVIDFSPDQALVENMLRTMSEIQSATGPSVSGGPFVTPGPTINGVPVAPSAQVGTRIPLNNYKVLHDAIFQAASDLGKRARERRKIVIVIADGHSGGDEHSFDETIARLLDAGIQVYAIGMDLSFLTRRLSVLNSYARDTGGDSFFVSSVDALETSYGKATGQARNQYVLGYVSSNNVAGRDPVFRQIDVRIARNGIETRHRKGYYQYP
jgi:VWFA-related protein